MVRNILYDENNKTLIYSGIATTVVGGIIGFIALRYHVASPDKILVRTGLGIKDMQFMRATIQWPLQDVRHLSVSARQVKVPVPGYVKEKIKVAAPITLIYRPDKTLYPAFAVAMSDKTTDEMDILIQEQAVGLMRQQIASMSAEDVYSKREELQKALIDDTKEAFAKWGIQIDSAVIDDVWDDKSTPESERVFANLSRRAIETAHTAARIATIIANADATDIESKKGKEIAEHNRDLDIAKITAKQAVEMNKTIKEQEVAMKTWELAKQVNSLKQEAFTADERASILSKAQADADKQRMLADANFYTQQQDANAILAKLTAEAGGMKLLVDSIGGSQNLVPYLVTKNTDVVVKLAEAQASAVKDMKPNVTISNWSHGEDAASLTKTMADITQVGAQLAKTLKEHTGMTLLPQLINPKQT